MQPNVHSSIIYSCQDLEQPKYLSTGPRIKKMRYVYSFIRLSHKKERAFGICVNMDEPGRHYTK